LILLVDTQILLWSALRLDRVPAAARSLMEDEANELVFSVVSIWEIAIKSAQGRPDFNVDPRRLRRQLLRNTWRELHITGEHALTVFDLPLLHKDPFDRLLLAQAIVEDARLVTVDRRLGDYNGPILRV
jgi:PIN domain nuclease of toxin-antitoxin system